MKIDLTRGFKFNAKELADFKKEVETSPTSFWDGQTCMALIEYIEKEQAKMTSLLKVMESRLKSWNKVKVSSRQEELEWVISKILPRITKK